jgi:hypothetical protein
MKLAFVDLYWTTKHVGVKNGLLLEERKKSPCEDFLKVFSQWFIANLL